MIRPGIAAWAGFAFWGGGLIFVPRKCQQDVAPCPGEYTLGIGNYPFIGQDSQINVIVKPLCVNFNLTSATIYHLIDIRQSSGCQ